MSSHDETSEHGQGPMSAQGNFGRPSPQIQHVPRRDGEEDPRTDPLAYMIYRTLDVMGVVRLTAKQAMWVASEVRAALPQPGGWRPSREELLAALEPFAKLARRCEGPDRQTWAFNIRVGDFKAAAALYDRLSLPPVPTDGGKQDGSASSNSATRLASQVCDTDAPSDLERELLAALQEIRDGMVASRDDISVEDWIEIADTAIQKAR